MVHALQECQRVLRAGGTLIDLRPGQRNRQVELELPSARLHLGEIGSASPTDDDLAADAALRQATGAGLFRLEHDERLEYVTEMDTLDDLREFGETLRRSAMPAALIERASQLTADEPEFIIRVRRQMLIARYRRL